MEEINSGRDCVSDGNKQTNLELNQQNSNYTITVLLENLAFILIY